MLKLTSGDQAIRLAIAGVPRGGKTTLARTLGAALSAPVRSTDDLVGLGWSQASERASTWFSQPGSFVIEGVAVPRALRKWLKANPTGRPVDELIVVTESVVPTTKGQDTLAKGCATVLAGIHDELIRRGVRITTGRAPALKGAA